MLWISLKYVHLWSKRKSMAPQFELNRTILLE